MNKRISFFGCSFTAGDELNDHKILNMSFEECNKLKSTYVSHKFYDMVNRQLSLGKDPLVPIEIGRELRLVEHNRKIAYPAKVSNILGVDYRNFAKGGSSLEQINISLMILAQANIISPERDVLFFGLTSIERILQLYENGIVTSEVLGYAKLPMGVVEHYTEYKLIWNYFSTLNSIMNFADLYGYKIMLQPMLKFETLNPFHKDFKKAFTTVDLDTWVLAPVVKQIWERAEKLIVLSDTTLYTTYEKYIHKPCGFGHPPEESHELFAELLAPRMKEILCLKD